MGSNKSSIGKLRECSWKISLQLSGAYGSNRFFGLILRKVNYLEFDETDEVPSIDDLQLPLLKRTEFEDEHEIRLVGFTLEPITSQGFALLCNLRHIISEIVIGPHGNQQAITEEIEERAADLRGIPIRPSTISLQTVG
jgi:hypothetical protein